MDKEQVFQNIGRQIAFFRKQNNITQLELAEKLNLSQAMVTAYETGKKSVSIARLLQLSKILEVSPDDILGFQIPESKKRGPVSKLDRQLDEIKKLPINEKKALSTVLDMALGQHAHVN